VYVPPNRNVIQLLTVTKLVVFNLIQPCKRSLSSEIRGSIGSGLQLVLYPKYISKSEAVSSGRRPAEGSKCSCKGSRWESTKIGVRRDICGNAGPAMDGTLGSAQLSYFVLDTFPVISFILPCLHHCFHRVQPAAGTLHPLKTFFLRAAGPGAGR
jgi:hypothetical protein